jgi:spermidine/putrescine transport system substrate-binding protein
MKEPDVKPTTKDKDVVGLVNEIAGGRMSRRQFIERGLVMGLSVSAIGTILAACGRKTKSVSTATLPPMDTTKPKTLNLFNWSDYMAPAVKKSFQKTTGIAVNETFYADNESLLAKLKLGATGYDVIVPSDYMIHIMLMSNLIQPLDMKYIPNYDKYVAPLFKNPPYDNPSENHGMKYSTPFQWGVTGIAVRKDKMTDPISKWSDLWNTKYKDQIDMLDDEREDLGAALKMLGYSYNSKSQSELDAATQKLIQQKPIVRTYDNTNMKRAIASGLWLTMCWNGDCLMALDEMGGTKALSMVNWVLPAEGYGRFVDNFAIPTGARSRYAAHLFLNYCLDPKIQADLVNYIWYNSPVPDSRKYTDPFALTLVPSDADLQRSENFNDLGAFATNYATAWRSFKSA